MRMVSSTVKKILPSPLQPPSRPLRPLTTNQLNSTLPQQFVTSPATSPSMHTHTNTNPSATRQQSTIVHNSHHHHPRPHSHRTSDATSVSEEESNEEFELRIGTDAASGDENGEVDGDHRSQNHTSQSNYTIRVLRTYACIGLILLTGLILLQYLQQPPESNINQIHLISALTKKHKVDTTAAHARPVNDGVTHPLCTPIECQPANCTAATIALDDVVQPPPHAPTPAASIHTYGPYPTELLHPRLSPLSDRVTLAPECNMLHMSHSPSYAHGAWHHRPELLYSYDLGVDTWKRVPDWERNCDRRWSQEHGIDFSQLNQTMVDPKTNVMMPMVRGTIQWEWHSDRGCSMRQHFDAEEFCWQMQGARIWNVGESIADQFHQTLRTMLRFRTTQIYPDAPIPYESYRTHPDLHRYSDTLFERPDQPGQPWDCYWLLKHRYEKLVAANQSLVMPTESELIQRSPIMTFVRNDFFTLSGEVPEAPAHELADSSRIHPFIKYIQTDMEIEDAQDHPVILIASSGVHFEHSDAATHEAQLRFTMNYIHQHLPNLTFIWRSAVSGFCKSEQLESPIYNTIAEVQDHDGSMPGWHYRDIPKRNDITMRVMEEIFGTEADTRERLLLAARKSAKDAAALVEPNVVQSDGVGSLVTPPVPIAVPPVVSFSRAYYLDTYPSQVLRVDGHISNDDCLHYCSPGPMDDNIYKFGQMIQQLKDQGIITRGLVPRS